MTFSDIFTQIATPQILFFAVGMLAVLVKSDLKIPEAMSTAMMLFLLVAIGLRGGIGLSTVSLTEALLPSLAAVALGVSIVLAGYFVLRRLKFDTANAGSIAGHYGAVSAVTMVMGFAYLDRIGVEYESFMPALYPFMDSFAIITAVVLTRSMLARGQADSPRMSMSLPAMMADSIRGKSVLVLVAALAIGYVSGESGTEQIMPFFGDMFRGILCLFMLDMGLVAAGRLHEWRAVGVRLVLYAAIAPLVHGTAGALLGTAAGLSVGGATMLAVFAASASYISAPAAMRSAVPEANPSLSLTAAVALTFPFNIVLGIPIYHAIAERIGG